MTKTKNQNAINYYCVAFILKPNFDLFLNEEDWLIYLHHLLESIHSRRKKEKKTDKMSLITRNSLKIYNTIISCLILLCAQQQQKTMRT